MPITVGYEVPFSLQAPIAYDAGRGRFLQEQDKYNFDVRQFEESLGFREDSLAEQARQFNLGQAYKYDVLDQSQSQFQDELALRSQQVDQRARLADAEMFLRQAGQASLDQYRQDSLDLQEKGQDYTERRDLRNLRTQKEQQFYSQGLLAAEQLAKFRAWRSPEQREQAWSQWDAVYGQAFNGMRPFQTPYETNRPEGSPVDDTRMMLQEGLGESYFPGMESLFYEEMDGEQILNRPALREFMSEQIAQKQKRADEERRLQLAEEKTEQMQQIKDSKELRANNFKDQQALSKWKKDTLTTFNNLRKEEQQRLLDIENKKNEFNEGYAPPPITSIEIDDDVLRGLQRMAIEMNPRPPLSSDTGQQQSSLLPSTSTEADFDPSDYVIQNHRGQYIADPIRYLRLTHEQKQEVNKLLIELAE